MIDRVDAAIPASAMWRGLTFAAALGGLGAMILVLSAAFLSAGKLLLLPYLLFVIVSAVTVRSSVFPRYAVRWAIGTAAFVIATVVLYIFVLAIGHNVVVPTFAGHLWRLAAIVGVGAALHAAVARITE